MRDDGNTVITDALRERLSSWAAAWRTPGLEKRIRLELSPRMRVALGRALPREKLVRINAAIVEHHPALVEEILCHEAAHVAVHELYRDYRQPHGPEWQELMRLAGFEPRVRMELASPLPGSRAKNVWEHQCPVCQARRTARRPVYRWRCAACVGAGLSGELTITKRPARGAA